MRLSVFVTAAVLMLSTSIAAAPIPAPQSTFAVPYVSFGSNAVPSQYGGDAPRARFGAASTPNMRMQAVYPGQFYPPRQTYMPGYWQQQNRPMYPYNGNVPHKKTWRERFHLTWSDAPYLVALKVAESSICYALRPCRKWHGEMAKKVATKLGFSSAKGVTSTVTRRSLGDSDAAL